MVCTIYVLLVFGSSFGLTQIKHRLVQYPVILDSLMNRPFRVMGGVYDICLACIWLILQTHPNKAQTRSISSDIGQLNE